jgi:hypothetical protein
MLLEPRPFFYAGYPRQSKRKKEAWPHCLSQCHASSYRPLAYCKLVASIIVSHSIQSSIRPRIGSNNLNVANSTPPSVCKACHCSGSVRIKDFRRRGVRYLDTSAASKQSFVVNEAIILIRWTCKACNFTYTDYPDFRPSL